MNTVSSSQAPGVCDQTSGERWETLDEHRLAGLLANAMFSENLDEMPLQRDEYGPSWNQQDMIDAAREILSSGFEIRKKTSPFLPDPPAGQVIANQANLLRSEPEPNLLGRETVREARPHEAPEWIWYGEVDGESRISFGRWPKNGSRWRYKWAETQPTEHDHPQTTRQAFEKIIAGLNYDGSDADSLTVGEIRRALAALQPSKLSG